MTKYIERVHEDAANVINECSEAIKQAAVAEHKEAAIVSLLNSALLKFAFNHNFTKDEIANPFADLLEYTNEDALVEV